MTKNSDNFIARALITTAGKSSRMGTAKALLPFNQDETFLIHLVNVYVENNIQPLIITNSILAPQLQAAIKPPAILAAGANPDWHMIDSLRYGLENLPDRRLPLFIQPVDMPFTNREIILAQLAARREFPKNFIIPETPKGSGHPLLCPPEKFSWIFSPACNQGLQRALTDAENEVYRLKWEDGRLACNINTREDYIQSIGSGSADNGS